MYGGINKGGGSGYGGNFSKGQSAGNSIPTPKSTPSPQQREEKSDFKKNFPETLFTRETIESRFQADDFHLTSFIEHLTSKTVEFINSNIADVSKDIDDKEKKDQRFDSYSRLLFDVFEASMFRLHDLNKVIKEEEESLKEKSRNLFMSQKQKLTELSGDLENIGKGFRQLEDFMNQVGNTAVQVGSTLEQTDIQKRKAYEAQSLLRYFQDFNQVPPSKFKEEVFAGENAFQNQYFKTSSDRMEGVHILKQLRIMTQDLKTAKNCENGVQNISFFKDYISDSLQREFLDMMVDEIDRSIMKKLASMAQLFFDFGEINDCIRLYTNRRFDVYLKIDRKEFDNDDATLEVSSSGDASDEGHLPGDVNFALKRLNNQKKLEGKRAKKCEAIAQSLKSTQLFEKFLQDMEKTLLDEGEIIMTVFPQNVTDATSLLMKSFVRILSNFLASDIMKSPGAISQYHSYLETLNSVYVSVTQTVKRITSSNVPFDEDEFQQHIDHIFSEKRLSYPQYETKQLNNYFELKLNEPKLNLSVALQDKKSAYALPAHVDVEIELGVVVEVMNYASSAFNRCKKLLDGKDNQAATAREIFGSLLSFITRYVSEGFATGHRMLNADRTTLNDASLEFCFRIVTITNAIVEKIHTHFETSVLPLITSHYLFKEECTHLVEDFFGKIESQLLGLLKSISTNIVLIADDILQNKQKRNDYSTSEVTEKCTSACYAWCRFFTIQLSHINTSLYKENREQFLIYLCNQLFKGIIRHLINRIAVVSTESFYFLNDMKMYRQQVGGLNVAIETQFNVLPTLGQVMMVAPDNIGIMIDRFNLSCISKPDLQAILRLRSDARALKNFLSAFSYGQGKEQFPSTR